MAAKVQHCLKCGNKTFPDVSSLRKHQWEAHPEFYKNVIHPKKKPSNGVVTAAQLLDRLKLQKQFITDMVDMVEGLMKQ